MKNLKKIASIFVVFAMMLTMMSVTSFAAGEATLRFDVKSNTIGTNGGEVLVDVYLEDAEGNGINWDILGFNVNIPYSDGDYVDYFTFEYVSGAVVGTYVADYSWAVHLEDKPGSSTTGTPITTFKIKTKDNAVAGSSYDIAITNNSISGAYTTLNTNLTDNKITLNVVQADEILTVDPVTAPADLTVGTSADAVIDALPEKVTVATTTNSSSVVGSEVSVTWAAPEDYSATKMTAQTFTGTLDVTDPITVADTCEVAVDVTLNPLTTGEITVGPSEYILKETKDGGTLDATAAVVAELNSVAIKNADGTVTDTYALANATVEENVTVTNAKDSSVEVTISVIGASENGRFNLEAEVTKKVTVKVVAAEIDGCAVELVSGNINKAPVVNVTVPAAEVLPDTVEENVPVYGVDANEDGTIDEEEALLPVMIEKIGENGEVEMEQKMDEETGEPAVDENGNNVMVPVMIQKTETVVTPNNEVVVTITGGDDPEAETVLAYADDFVIDDNDTEDTSDDTATISVEFAKKLSAMGFANNDEITVSAKLNGAALIVGYEDQVDEDGNPVQVPVLTTTATAKKPVVGTAGGIKPTAPSTDSTGSNQGGSTGSTGTDAPVVVPTEPDKVPSVEAPFADVAADHWAAADIAALKDAAIVSGSGDGNYYPEADITRAEFTKMVVGLLGLEATSTEVAFEDCAATDWFTPYVAAAVEAGLVTGVSETEFAPNATITREQAFAIIGRAVIGVEANTTLTFADVADIDEYAVPYVTILVQSGIVEGYPDGTVRPDANITRAEAAKVIAGLMSMVVTEEEVTEEVVEEEATEEAVAEEAAEEEVVEEETTEEAVVEEEAAEELVEDVTEEAAEDSEK